MRELQEKSGVLKNEAPATIGKTGWDSGSLAARLSGSTREALHSPRPRLSETTSPEKPTANIGLSWQGFSKLLQAGQFRGGWIAI